jgi:Uncharacterized protein conserved in bacteria (DUF2171)
MSQAPEPVSWLLIEPGWKLEAADGVEVGKVEEVVGDSTHDIFNGLTVAPGLLGRPRYVPAELVAEIHEGRIRLSLEPDGFEKLGEYEEPPPSEQFRAD